MCRKGFVLLLLLALLGFCLADSTYVVYTDGYNGMDYYGWRDYLWSLNNPSGFCAHMATYETEDEFNQILTAVENNPLVQELEGFQFYLGAQKQPNSNTFVWAVGSRRGQPFFSVDVNSYLVSTYLPLIDLSMESGFICHQEYCFEPHKFLGYRLVYNAEYEAVFIVSLVYYGVFPDLYSNTPIGVAEYEQPVFFPNAEGGSKFGISTSTATYYEATYDSLQSGVYLARLESQEQFNWIMDELQCLGEGGVGLWLGYERDYITDNIVKGPGPSQGQVLYSWYTEDCVSDLYCNFNVDLKSRGKRGLDVYSITPRFYHSETALMIDTTSSSVVETSVSDQNYFLVQAEYCSINADQFYRFNFAEDRYNQLRMCQPNPTSDWASNEHILDGFVKYFAHDSFVAASAQVFVNDIYNPDVREKVLYFDCNCKTDPKIDLACLGSDAFPGGCDLYTDTEVYYYFGLYYDRLKQGLNYTYKRVQQYFYWEQIYQFFWKLKE